MSATSDNNKRIAKNTLMLYFRQILVLVVSLYTSRVILNVLGVDDYGIYNVVGGIVTMFSFITGTMASASQRFLSYDLAKNDPSRLRQTFSLIMLSYLILIVVCLVLSEAIAVWFLNAKMNIPADRLEAANWVLQFSILSFVVNIFSAPYMSVIISRERMSVYAYASIVEVVLRLLIVYMLTIIAYDKLKVYAVLMFLSTCSITTFYRLYCKKRFSESHYFLFFDRKRFKELCSFATWNIIGSLSNVLRSQGINILLNLFFNPAINAARGVAYQVNSAIINFSNNFYTAVVPQITKNYASGDIQGMYKLIFASSRFAFYLIFVISLPILLLTQRILDIWLKNPPTYASVFVRLVIINSMLDLLQFPLVKGLQAAGKIRTDQSIVSTGYLLVLPISYFFYTLHYPPETAMCINIIIGLICFIPRLYICRVTYGLRIRAYISQVLLKLFIVIIPLSLLCWWIRSLFKFDTLISVVLFILTVVICSLIVIYCIGLYKEERKYFNNFAMRKLGIAKRL